MSEIDKDEEIAKDFVSRCMAVGSGYEIAGPSGITELDKDQLDLRKEFIEALRLHRKQVVEECARIADAHLLISFENGDGRQVDVGATIAQAIRKTVGEEK